MSRGFSDLTIFADLFHAVYYDSTNKFKDILQSKILLKWNVTSSYFFFLNIKGQHIFIYLAKV